MVDNISFHSNKIKTKMPITTNKQIGFRANDNNKLEEENITSRGSMGQDIYDPFYPANKMDPLSPYYENNLNKGVFGQDIYNPADPMNKMDINSPYYEGGLGSSNGYGSEFGGDGFGGSGFGY